MTARQLMSSDLIWKPEVCSLYPQKTSIFNLGRLLIVRNGQAGKIFETNLVYNFLVVLYAVDFEVTLQYQNWQTTNVNH